MYTTNISKIRQPVIVTLMGLFMSILLSGAVQVRVAWEAGESEFLDQRCSVDPKLVFLKDLGKRHSANHALRSNCRSVDLYYP